MIKNRWLFILVTIFLLAQTNLSAQVFEPEEKKVAPPKKEQQTTRSTPNKKVQPAKSSTPTEPQGFATLVVSTDLDVRISVNGKKEYTVRTNELLSAIPIDKGKNFIKVVPLDGGDDAFFETISVSEKENILLEIDLAAKRQAAEEERKAELRRQEEEKKRMEEEKRRQEEERLAELRRQEEEKKRQEEVEMAAIREIEGNMIYIAGGSFRMGCTSEQSNCGDDEKPAHYVSLPAFYLNKYEVTNAAYCLFLNEKGNQQEGGVAWLDIESSHCKIRYTNGQYLPETGYGNHPVVNVSFYGAGAFCGWLSKKTGKTYRLPSESEWEYAARGGNRSGGYKYAGSNSLDEVGWYSGNSGSKLHQVGGKSANELGLYDMSGNVWEWCQDCWNGSYAGAPTNGSAWQSGDCGRRVLRGGSWGNLDGNCRVSDRDGFYPTGRNGINGFRLAQGR